MDGASGPLSKISSTSDKATDKILKASGATDTFNKKLDTTSTSATKSSNGLNKLVTAFLSLAAVQKGISIVDEYTNTSARLGLITDSLEEQKALQDQIFASANRSRGVYSDMASAVAKLGITAGEAFGSNNELVAFTELVQKGFKVGGASQSEQSAAMLQLTQAMGSGKLQGDEFRSIMENAPMIADAIAKYVNVSKGELKELASEGVITSDIIKNAIFAASDGINEKFESMPMTFADVWNRIKNGGTQAFTKIMEKINGLINTDGFKQFIDGIIVGFDLLSQVVGWLIDTIVNGWDTIGPILALIGGVLLISMIGSLWAMVPPLIAQAAAWLAVYWPLLLVIGIIAILISAARQFGATWEEIFGFVGGIIGIFAGYFYNQFVSIWNMVAAFINFFGNVFTHPIASIKVLFYDLVVSVLGHIETMARGIENLLNKIPGVEVNITGGITDLKDKLAAKAADIKDESELIEYAKSKEYMDYSDSYKKGSDMGKNVADSIGDAVYGLTDKMTKGGSGDSLGGFGSASDPLTVKGKGKNDKVDVNMSDEDMQYLRDIAERDYINKFSTNTLAPNVTISFGDVHETADANKVAGRIKKILQEEIALTAEGAY